MGIPKVRLVLDRRAEVPGRFLQVPLLRENVGQVVVRLRIKGVDLERSPERLGSIVSPALSHQEKAVVVTRFIEVWI